MKILNDILKSPAEKYSMKRIIIFVVMVFILLLGTFIVLSDKVLEHEVNRYAIDVFDGLLIFVASLLGLAEVGKKFLNKVEQKDEENAKPENQEA